jgi:peptidoglycan/xylan/chitin deacetylase (PgdA/CDA1 family)
VKLTILMYHKIDELRPGVRYPGNYVTPRQFQQQMDSLLLWGYRSISLEQWLDYRDGRLTSLPKKPFIVTFDDGYTCFERHAWPVLKDRGIRATVFLVASQIGGYNAWDQNEVREPLLSASAIHGLQRDGVHFGSHSVHHVPLARIEPRVAMRELSDSRAQLSDLLGFSVDTFAYPYSNQNSDIRKMALAAGYRCAVRGKGRMCRPSTDPFGLYRIKPDLGQTPEQFRQSLFRARYLRW